MSQTQPDTLMDLIMNLLRDPAARASFEADPEGYLQANGFSDVTPADVQDVTPLVMESATPLAAALPSPPAVAPGDTSLQSAIEQIQFIRQNFSLDQDFEIDQSKTFELDQSQTVQAIGEGSVAGLGDISGVATGPGSLAAGDDLEIDGQVATTGGTAAGPDAQVFEDSPGAQAFRDSQVVQGQDNTVGFGDGDVSSARAGDGGTAVGTVDDVEVDDGGAFSIGGKARGENEENEVDVRAEDDAQVNLAVDDSQADQVDDIDQSQETRTEIDASQEIDSSQRLDQQVESEGDTTVLG